jgi:hypothetical protein
MHGWRHREQRWHVPGPVKAYSWAGYCALQSLPRTVGFDVMDEVALRRAGFRVTVRAEAGFAMARDIGASEGRLAGRRRNGMVCRYTGYDLTYFLLHMLRYSVRRPYVVGSLAMLYGYCSAPPSPYADDLRQAHRLEQRAKLSRMVRQPAAWLRATYGTRSAGPC